jgi:hypothetical protein
MLADHATQGSSVTAVPEESRAPAAAQPVQDGAAAHPVQDGAAAQPVQDDAAASEPVDGQTDLSMENIGVKDVSKPAARREADGHVTGPEHLPSASASPKPIPEIRMAAVTQHGKDKDVSSTRPASPQKPCSPHAITGKFKISTGQKNFRIIGAEQMQSSVDRLYHGYSSSPPAAIDPCASTVLFILSYLFSLFFFFQFVDSSSSLLCKRQSLVQGAAGNNKPASSCGLLC